MRDVEINRVDVYPVGWLAAWKRHHIRTYRRIVARWIRRGNWRAVCNSFNGYLAEHEGHQHDAGRGWTKRRAIRRAEAICQRAARDPYDDHLDDMHHLLWWLSMGLLIAGTVSLVWAVTAATDGSWLDVAIYGSCTVMVFGGWLRTVSRALSYERALSIRAKQRADQEEA